MNSALDYIYFLCEATEKGPLAPEFPEMSFLLSSRSGRLAHGGGNNCSGRLITRARVQTACHSAGLLQSVFVVCDCPVAMDLLLSLLILIECITKTLGQL